MKKNGTKTDVKVLQSGYVINEFIILNEKLPLVFKNIKKGEDIQEQLKTNEVIIPLSFLSPLVRDYPEFFL